MYLASADIQDLAIALLADSSDIHFEDAIWDKQWLALGLASMKAEMDAQESNGT